MQADVAKAEDVKRMMRLTRDLFGSLDMLVNNAYFAVNKYIWEMDEEEFSSCVDVCLKSAFLTSKYVLHLMREGEGGIINTYMTASQDGLLPLLRRQGRTRPPEKGCPSCSYRKRTG